MEKVDGSPQNNTELASTVSKLTIMRDLSDPFRTNGDMDSINTATIARDSLISLVHQKPEQLPEIIKELVEIGKNFESIKIVELRNSLVGRQSNSWVDGQLSSQMVTETVLGIGKTALPFLEKNNEKHAKFLASKLRSNIRAQERERLLEKISSQIKNLIPKTKAKKW